MGLAHLLLKSAIEMTPTSASTFSNVKTNFIALASSVSSVRSWAHTNCGARPLTSHFMPLKQGRLHQGCIAEGGTPRFAKYSVRHLQVSSDFNISPMVPALANLAMTPSCSSISVACPRAQVFVATPLRWSRVRPNGVIFPSRGKYAWRQTHNAPHEGSTASIFVSFLSMFDDSSAAISALHHWAKHFDKVCHSSSKLQHRLDTLAHRWLL